jgi:hypothetical protein
VCGGDTQGGEVWLAGKGCVAEGDG